MDYFISPLLFFIFISCIMLYHALYSLMIVVLGLLDLPLVFVLWKYVLIFLSYIFVGPKPSDLYGKHTWKIEKFSQLTKRELRSNAFEVGGYKWYVDGYIFEINSVPSNIFNIFWSPCLQVSCIFSMEFQANIFTSFCLHYGFYPFWNYLLLWGWYIDIYFFGGGYWWESFDV